MKGTRLSSNIKGGVWVETFDYSKRHCYPTVHGTYRAYQDNGIHPQECKDWQKHPYKVGHTEFLRWIRNFGTLVTNLVSGNTPEGSLKLGPDTTIDGKNLHCENYGGKVKAFLDNIHGLAFVEVHDESLFEAAEKASELTDMEYVDMARSAVTKQTG